VSSKDICRSF